MDEDLDTVEDMAFAVVGVEGFGARDLGVGVVVLHIIVVHDDRKSTAYDLIVYDYDDLPLGEKCVSVCRSAPASKRRRFRRHRLG